MHAIIWMHMTQKHLHFKHLTKDRSKCCSKILTKWQKKDADPVLTDLFPVAPALTNGAISTSVTLKEPFFVMTIDIYCLKTLTNCQHKSKNLTKIILS